MEDDLEEAVQLRRIVGINQIDVNPASLSCKYTAGFNTRVSVKPVKPIIYYTLPYNRLLCKLLSEQVTSLCH